MLLNKVLKVCLGLFLATYAIYVVGAWVFLNTSVFAKVADMQNDDQTYVKLHGAISPFPGFLYVNSGRLFISDQNVSIGIDLTEIGARFSLLPLLKKRLVLDKLHIKEAKVDLGMKSPEESFAYQKKYVTADSLDLKKRAEYVKAAEISHLTLEFPELQIDTISQIKSELGDFQGGVTLTGGFVIQPKVYVEVFPTTLKFYKGEIPDQFTSVQGEAKASIARFRMIDAPGNAVFPYFTANLRLDMNVKSLKMLDMTLRKLPGYAFEGRDTRLSVRADLVKGKLQKGTNISATPTQLSIHSPGVTATGFGEMKWEVDSETTSKLSAHMKNVKVVQNSDAFMAGSLKKLDLGIKLFGTELLDAFHGLFATITLDHLRWNIESKGKNPNLQYQGEITGNGSLSGYSGEVPQSLKESEKKASDLSLKIKSLNLKTSFLSSIKGTGSIDVFARPVDLGANSVEFPKVNVGLDLQVGKYGMVKSKATFRKLEYRLFPVESWKGELEWDMDTTVPYVDALRDQDKLSAILGTVARVHDLVIKMDVEAGKKYSWLRFNEVSSSGIWKAYGTLTNQEEGMKGLFETKVLSLPIGIRVTPQKTDIKFLPSSEWYDESPADYPHELQ
jgi:hypothetical protein